MSNTVTLLVASAPSQAGSVTWEPGVRGKVFQAAMDATVSAAAVVEIIGSVDKTSFTVLGTMTLSGASDVKSLVNNDAWPFIAARTTAAAVTGEVTVKGHAIAK